MFKSGRNSDVTYGHADVSDAAVSLFKTLHVLAHLNDHADGFVTGNELWQALAHISPEQVVALTGKVEMNSPS